MSINVVLVEPEIPANTGNIARFTWCDRSDFLLMTNTSKGRALTTGILSISHCTTVSTNF